MTQLSNVPMQPTGATEPLTLIEKLEREVNRLLELKAQEKPHSLGYVFLGHHIAATVNAINIVKEYKCTWKGVYIYHAESTCYGLSCGNMGEDVDIFKYCPYCGGEIEFSEV